MKFVQRTVLIVLMSLVAIGTVTARGAREQVVGDRLVVGQTLDATSLDPQKQGNMASMNILINIFDTLVWRDPQGNLIPSLATEWRAIDDYTWRFTLRQGVRFHNGEYFDAHAVKFTMDRIMDPATASPIAELRHLVAANVIDTYTIDLVTDGPDPIMPARLVLFGGVIMPPRHVTQNTAEYVARNPVGTGPYRFVSWHRDSHVTLEAFDDHWRGPPPFRHLVFRIVPSWADMSAGLRTGEIHLAQGVPADLHTELRASPNINLLSAPWIQTAFISIDTAVPPLNIREVRQAMNYAVDVQTIIDTLLGGNAHQVSTIIPRQNFGFDPNIPPFPYNPARARQLLAQAGVPNGFEVTFDANALAITTIMAIVSYLEAVGIRVNINMMDFATLSQRMAAGTASPLYFSTNTGWTMDALSNYQSFAHRERRFARGGTDELDALVIFQETTIDPAARQRAFTRAQEIMREEAFFIYLWQANNVIAVNSGVDFTPTVIGIWWMFNARPAR